MIFGVICVEVSRKFSKNPHFWQKVFLQMSKFSKVFLQRWGHPPPPQKYIWYILGLFGEGRDGNKIFLLGGLAQDHGVDGGHYPHQKFDGGGGKIFEKMRKYLVLKGSKYFAVPVAPRKKPCLPYFRFLFPIFRLFRNFSKISPKFSKTAPSAPNFGRFPPKILHLQMLWWEGQFY